MIERAFTHCTNESDKEIELDQMRTVLMNNGYPVNLINDIINKCRNKFSNRNIEEVNNEFDIEKVFCIPYYRHISEQIRKVLFKYDINVVFRKGKTIKSCLNNNYKPNNQKSGVVYQVSCNDCEAVYVGHTKRKLEDRIKEHKRALYSPNLYNSSNIAYHAINEDHSINFENPSINH